MLRRAPAARRGLPLRHAREGARLARGDAAAGAASRVSRRRRAGAVCSEAVTKRADSALEEAASTLLEEAARGADGAWERLVARFERFVMAFPRESGLPSADCDEVFQRTWIALHRQVALIRDPRSLPAWIATTARRQVWRVQRDRALEARTEGLGSVEGAEDGHDPAREAVSLERRELVQECVARLDPRCRRLLELLYLDERDLGYDGVARELGLSRGTIGPARIRCLEKLARLVESVGLEDVE